MVAGRMRAAAQGVRNQDGIGPVGVELAVGFIHHGHRTKGGPTVQLKGLVLSESQPLRLNEPD